MKRSVKLMDGSEKEIEIQDRLNIIERNKILSECSKTRVEGKRVINETDLFLLQTLTLRKVISGVDIEQIDTDDCDEIFEGYKGFFGLSSKTPEEDKKKE